MYMPMGDPEIIAVVKATGSNEHRGIMIQAVLANRLVEGLAKHGEALTRAAEASDRYAGRLVWATWALVLATAVLVLVEVLH